MTPNAIDDDDLDAIDEETWRDELNLGGIEDKTKQDAIITLITKRQKRLAPAKNDTEALSQLVASPTSTDAQIAELLAKVRTALRREHDGRVTEAEELDAKIGFSHDARTENTLVFLGVIGDAGAIMDAVSVALELTGTASLNEVLADFKVADPQTKGVLGAFVQQLLRAMQPTIDWANEKNPRFQGQADGPNQEQWRQYLDTFRQKTAKVNKRRQDGLVRLDARLGYTRDPRLDAIVFLTGISDPNITLLTPRLQMATLSFSSSQIW